MITIQHPPTIASIQYETQLLLQKLRTLQEQEERTTQMKHIRNILCMCYNIYFVERFSVRSLSIQLILIFETN